MSRWNTFDRIVNSGIDSDKKGQYKSGPANGIPELRKTIAEQTNKDFKLNYTPEQVTVTTGEATLFAAFQSILDANDEVIVPAPYWVGLPLYG